MESAKGTGGCIFTPTAKPMSGIARSLYNLAANVPREKRKFVTLGALGGTWLLAYAITSSRITDSKLVACFRPWLFSAHFCTFPAWFAARPCWHSMYQRD
jgi:hypothetical protein